MDTNFKNIHIGSYIKQRKIELEIENSRVCKFIKCNEEDIEEMFLQSDLNTSVLLKWSKILEYDFFRLYSQHLILFSPAARRNPNETKKISQLPHFRKSIYTKEIIEFILDLINSGEKTKQEIINEYRIPKTTLFKWILKYDDRQTDG
ncbi:transposase [Chryseobacterium sp. SIMBA_028]|uniref:transposase n=1 Tax=Chryseobacterium sp. SIMBA_028 TaxID=3085771 RepID=UPI00397B79C7